MNATVKQDAGYVAIVNIDGVEHSLDVTDSVEAILDVEKRIAREEMEDENNRLTLEVIRLKSQVVNLHSLLERKT